MSDISSTQLRAEIQAVLKNADLATISAKRVREQVEGKLNCSLLSRKKEFDKIVMEVINEQQDDENSEDDDGNDPDADPQDDSEQSEEESAASSSEEEKKKKPGPKKRPQPTKHKVATKKKRKSLKADDSGTESDAGSDSDYEVVKKPTPKKKAAKAAGGSGTGRKSTGFTRAYNLSPELSALMGADSLPRHEVVKKVWAIIKERDLYDPKNKQFAICDDELMKIMKVKRFRTFGMLKHLKPHFLD
ncbi:CG1240 [Drosophila busckii]|uniref:CG1240 n=1 Tax=Drosophila busckii TaxID=30019 RepID=A0A0M5J5Q9_DROBS|nr:upstream activation factor subunit spp27 [Drosophila busckii]ALC43631.1 CG1240 [Drosophila busckii]